MVFFLPFQLLARTHKPLHYALTLNSRTSSPIITYILNSAVIPLLVKIKTIQAQSDSNRSDPNRVSKFGEFFLNSIAPTKNLSDLAVFNDNKNHVFLGLVRKEFLRAKYQRTLNEIIKSKTNTKTKTWIQRYLDDNKDDNKDDVSSKSMPTVDMVEKTFNLQSWHRKPITASSPPPHRTSLINALDPTNSIAHWDMEQVIEAAGGSVYGHNEFNLLMEESNWWEIWSREYCSALAQHLSRACRSSSNKETVVLEVCAGDGRLTKYLSSTRFGRKGKGEGGGKQAHNNLRTRENVKFVATDNGSWGIDPNHAVEKLDVVQALEKYAGKKGEEKNINVIVICAWHPMACDLTYLFRANTNVSEYIMIGQTDNGNCGCPWLTWGNEEFNDDNAPNEVLRDFERHDLKDLSRLQLSRYNSSEVKTSNTVSFKRRVT